MLNKLTKNKHGNHFNSALFVVLLSTVIILVAFISEDNKITGFATSDSGYFTINPILIEFKDVNSLGTLAPGNYYIDDRGIVYWMDDESRPPIAKVDYINDVQKNRQIYIDDNGNVGYILS